MFRAGRKRSVRFGLDHRQRALAHRQGDGVRAGGVLVADPQRIPGSQGGVGQLVKSPPDLHPFGPAFQREHRQVEVVPPRVGAGLTGQQIGDTAALVLQHGAHPPLFQPEAGAEVGQGVLQPAAPQAPQQQHFGVALAGGQLGRVLGVGVVLDVGQDHQVLPRRRHGTGSRIEVPHHGVGPAAQGLAVVIARVTGDQVVVRPQQAGQRRADRAGRNDDAARHIPHSPLQFGLLPFGLLPVLDVFHLVVHGAVAVVAGLGQLPRGQGGPNGAALLAAVGTPGELAFAQIGRKLREGVFQVFLGDEPRPPGFQAGKAGGVGDAATKRLKDGHFPGGVAAAAQLAADGGGLPAGLGQQGVQQRGLAHARVAAEGAQPPADPAFHLVQPLAGGVVDLDKRQGGPDISLFQEVRRTIRTNNPFSESIDSVFVDTDFVLTGDQFASHFGQPQTATVGFYETSMIALEADTTVMEDTADNMASGSEGQLSAPATVRFTAYANEPVAALYEWRIYRSDTEDGANNPLVLFRDSEIDYTFSELGSYTAEVTVYNRSGGCEASASFDIEITESFLEIPNAFSPGTTPGINDEFRVAYRSLLNYNCWIFNRWGQELYSWSIGNIDDGWDGTYKGKTVSNGVYFIVVVAEGADGVEYKKKSSINVMTGISDGYNNGTYNQ